MSGVCKPAKLVQGCERADLQLEVAHGWHLLEVVLGPLRALLQLQQFRTLSVDTGLLEDAMCTAEQNGRG